MPILHLGTAAALLDRPLQALAGPLTMRSFQLGDGAVLQVAADRLNGVSLIDRQGSAPARPYAMGTTLVLAASKRVVQSL